MTCVGGTIDVMSRKRSADCFSERRHLDNDTHLRLTRIIFVLRSSHYKVWRISRSTNLRCSYSADYVQSLLPQTFEHRHVSTELVSDGCNAEMVHARPHLVRITLLHLQKAI